ncbi:MAG: hypothetical protein EU535_08585, partial [Promethearchaeota archaeon]
DGIVDLPYTWISGVANSEDGYPLAENPIHLGEKVNIDDSGINAWNWSKTAKLKVWCSGSGLWNDPYIIDGLTIDGGDSGSCITINNSNVYFIIHNCIVYKAGSGIHDAGIKLENTSNGTLTNNNCSNNNRFGIELFNGCKNNTITSNIAGNIGTTNQDFGIHLEFNCNNNTITNNIANNNMFNGIDIYNACNNNTISGNTAGNIDTTNQAIGIVLHTDCDDNTIIYNMVNNNRDNGIFLFNCKNNRIFSNTAGNIGTRNQDIGIYLDTNSNDNTIKNNTANNNLDYGIYLLYFCDSNTISNNIINNNTDCGIYLENTCRYNTISKNIIGDVDIIYQDIGICLYDDSHTNTIFGNLIINNQNYGISINDLFSSNNIIYHNALIGTIGWHANDDGTNNCWNKSYIGNYWDNHTTPDINNDGIVDLPYRWISGVANSEDGYPLAESPIHIGGKIHIDDSGVNAPNWSRTVKLNFWCSGSGVWNDPYIIDGLRIDGAGSGNCITINNSNVYFIIRNCVVYNAGFDWYDAGIKLENTSNGTLINNNCSNNGRLGILLANNCDNNTVSGNTANNFGSSTIQDFGILLYRYCDNNTISGNTANNNWIWGIRLEQYCNNNTVSGNTASNVGTTNQDYGMGLYFYCHNNTISGNIIHTNTLEGMDLRGNCQHNTISENTIENNFQYGIYVWDNCDNNNISENIANDNGDIGIYLDTNCNDNIIFNNTANNNIYYGIRLYDDCDNNNISENIANDNGDSGIFLDSNCDGNTISGNTANHNDNNGIYLNICRYCNISGNTANDNGDNGIYLLFSINNTISGNKYSFNNNGICGIFLENSDWNNITDNIVLFNGKYGICLNSSSYNNIFYNNCTGNPIPLYEDPYCVGNVFIENLPITPPSKLPILLGGDDDDEKPSEPDNLALPLIIVGIASAVGIASIAIYLIKKRAKLRK